MDTFLIKLIVVVLFGVVVGGGVYLVLLVIEVREGRAARAAAIAAEVEAGTAESGESS